MKHAQTVEQRLNAYLRKGETVGWAGRTERFGLLDKDAKCAILTRWIGTVAAVGAFLGLYIGNNEKWSISTVVGVLAVGVLLLLSPVIDRSRLLKQRYWITDQRVILMSGDGSFTGMELARLDGFRVERIKTPNPTLILGQSLIEEGDRQLRWRGCHPKMDKQSASAGKQVVEGLVLYSVTDGARAEACLKKQENTLL